VNMLFHMAKEILSTNEELWDGESSLDYPGGLTLIVWVLKKRTFASWWSGGRQRVMEEMEEEGREDARWEVQPTTAEFVKGRSGARVKECMCPIEARKGKEMECLLQPPGGMHSCPSLILAHLDSCQTSDLQNCKIINMCYFKPPNLE